MKKYLILLAAAVAALIACNKNDPEKGPDPKPSSSVIFDLDAGFDGDAPDSKAGAGWVKSGWETGDVIFVFSDQVAAPNHLKMTYTSNGWTYAESPGPMGLKNGDTGTFRAVYLPFGSSASVAANGENFMFNKTYLTLYWTATLGYTVSNGKVSGTFNMVVPDDFVQFWIQDDKPVNEAYKLATDAVQPTGVTGVKKDGSLLLETSYIAGGNMPGYAYAGGYLFSGKMVSGYAYGSNYYFAKTKTADSSRADYFVTGKTLTNHCSVPLPANSNAKWLAVGSGKTVDLLLDNVSYGKWYTCNHEATSPEKYGTVVDFNEASALVTSTRLLPTQAQFNSLVTDLTWTRMSIRGTRGMVVSAGANFIFLPISDYSSEVYYWGQANYHLYFKANGTKSVGTSESVYNHCVRFLAP